MAFNTAAYWTFFAIALLLSAALRGHPRVRVWFLTAASFYFYYASNGYYLTLLIVFGTFFDFIAAKKIEASESEIIRKRWLTASLTSNLLILGTFKYLNFFLSNGTAVLHSFGVPVKVPAINLLLPVGISFYTFEAISYVVDVYKKRFHARKSWREFNFFIIFFPKLTAGPIIRPQTFFQNAKQQEPATVHAFETYIQMIFLGLFQKVVLADTIAPFADAVYSGTAPADSLTTLVGVYAFALQIYFDFVGYTNIAIGSAGLLGIDLPENFRRPYIATCVSDFWRRWHISLSSWLRDYLYIPLGGGRGSLLMTCRNLMITMTLGGLWHGASWNFVIWGGLNGGLLCIERVFGVESAIGSWLAAKGLVARIAWSTVTFNVFALLWIPFRAHSVPEFVRVVQRLFALRPPDAIMFEEFVICALALGTIAVCAFDEGFDFETWAARLHPLIKAPAFALSILLAYGFSAAGSQPFIYFRF